MLRRFRSLALLLPVLMLGCHSGKAQTDDAGPPEVLVSIPVTGELVNYEVFTGRTLSVNRVDLKCRVTGYLDKIYVGRDADKDGPVVKEGGDVKKGDVLFVIQQKPFRDALTQAEKNLDSLTTQRDYNRRYLERLRTGGTSVSENDRDTAETAWRTSVSQGLAAAAAVEKAKQDLEWATITAPFDGRIGKRLVDRGNDVKADETILGSIEQINPLYAYFDVDERTTLRINKYLANGKVPADAAEIFPVALGLANEKSENFTHPGTLQFADNKVDPSTGTLRMYGEFKNPQLDLKSGMFVRVRMGIGEAQKTLFIAETALTSDQGRKYVFVVNDQNKVVYTPVEVGQRKDGLISVKGLKGDERIIVDGLQRVKTKMEVAPKEVPMPRATDEEVIGAATR